MQKLNQKRPPAPDDEKRIAEIRASLVAFNRRNSSPAISEMAILHVIVAPDAAPGRREIRLAAAPGLTNPIAFYIGQLPEYTRPPERVLPAFSVVNGATPPNRPTLPPELPVEIQLPAILNGQMMPARTDRYRFHAAKDQRLVISAGARELIPYISDAVPGWFQAVLTLRDSQGKELASADHYLFQQDPVLIYNAPADGDYLLDIHDSIYRGREDFVYRITIGDLPVPAPAFPVSAAHTAPKETHAARNNHRREAAQRLKLPSLVEGRVGAPAESEFFRFDGRAGEEMVAEVTARRQGSPLDSQLRLTDSAGRELAFNDDFDDPAAGLLTHQADSHLAIKLPSKGTYYLELSDAQRQGGPDFAYRLRVSHPQPDFELRLVPSSINLRGGAYTAVTVHAIRRDGFSGRIALSLNGMLPGFELSGAIVPEGQDEVRVTLLAPPRRTDVPVEVHLEGRAQIAGREVRHAALPADDMMQAFAYRHLVPAQAGYAYVIGAGRRIPWKTIAEPIQLTAGGTAEVRVFVPPALAGQVHMALDDPPPGISIASATPVADGVALVLRADPAKAKAGLKGNLIVDAFRDAPAPPANSKANPNAARRRQFLGALPAIPFEIAGAATLTRR